MTPPADIPGVIARPPLLYGGALLIVLALRWFWPLPLFGQAAVLWAGLAIAALSICFGIWGRRAMVVAGTSLDPLKPSTAVVTSGPFRISRNPLYLAMTLLFLGLTLALNTWWGIVALVPLLLIVHRGVILREERYLEHKFGDDYRRYKAGVPRYVRPI
jgi:protein-S-isoprenylcysteine O-methyltransferase Ste14